mmetsp:Transcript_23659/g.76052  ORF Transcript_23659/g.76052 Transcript_23659/m.76052 type:complete len:145 (-) Transcript_23659:143-577(-)
MGENGLRLARSRAAICARLTRRAAPGLRAFPGRARVACDACDAWRFGDAVDAGAGAGEEAVAEVPVRVDASAGCAGAGAGCVAGTREPEPTATVARLKPPAAAAAAVLAAAARWPSPIAVRRSWFWIFSAAGRDQVLRRVRVET